MKATLLLGAAFLLAAASAQAAPRHGSRPPPDAAPLARTAPAPLRPAAGPLRPGATTSTFDRPGASWPSGTFRRSPGTFSRNRPRGD